MFFLLFTDYSFTVNYMTEIKIVSEGAKLDEIMAIETSSFTSPWSREFFESVLSSDRAFITEADFDGHTVGFACVALIPPEAELMNIAVDKKHRKKGFAASLLDFSIKKAISMGGEVMYLEVRESNTAARHLYEKFGFEMIGTRRNYYTLPRENAVIMRLDLKKER